LGTRDRENYFEKSLPITRPPGDHIFEFIIEATDRIGVFKMILDVFAKQRVDVRTISASPEDGEKKLFVTSLFADFSKARTSMDGLLEEIRELAIVRRAYAVDMKGRLFDRFLFPLRIMNSSRVLLLRVEPLLNVEKRLVQQMGSAGAAIMYEEGGFYAAEAFKEYRASLPDAETETLLENIKDGLRVTGWGIFTFKRTSEGFEVSVRDPPMLLDGDYKENHFFYGATAKILEILYGDALNLTESTMDSRNKRLVFRFRKK
jgi:hypothetical protein